MSAVFIQMNSYGTCFTVLATIVIPKLSQTPCTQFSLPSHPRYGKLVRAHMSCWLILRKVKTVHTLNVLEQRPCGRTLIMNLVIPPTYTTADIVRGVYDMA